MAIWNLEYRRVVARTDHHAVPAVGVAQAGDDPVDEFELVHLAFSALSRRQPPVGAGGFRASSPPAAGPPVATASSALRTSRATRSKTPLI